MAKKDTMNALLKRSISEETATLLLTKYSTLSDISGAKESELVELGMTEDEAKSVLSKVGKRTTSSSSRSSKKKVEDEVPAVPMEEVTEFYTYNETELMLKDIMKKEDIELPMKIIVDIAARIEGHDVPEDKCRELIVRANDMYQRHRMDQNESAGVMAAHSIGEPGTQMNMRTFHYAGVANINVTQGLPRLIEIVDARRIPSTPSMDIPLSGIAAQDESVARLVASNIEMTSILDVATIDTDITNMTLIVKPNIRKMEERHIEVDELVDKLNKVKAVRGMVKLSGYDIVIQSDEPSYKKLQAMYDAVKTAKIKGIDGITRAVLSKTEGYWKIVTEGSNLKEVLTVEGVDAQNVMTNSILEVADVLGIEAARNSIIHEAMGTLGEAGLDVDIRHIMLVADLMTNDGYVKAIGRHGVSGKKSSVLARAAFEITAAHLLHAAMVGEVDHLEGVTENIIVGQPVTLGTGAVNLIYTPKKKGDKE
ncbi:MAG: DNA-directed RNA polymerase subunit A'' [Candidatus Methanomethylophilaceae archaeon]|nr:DNA-directed RNA polymerase subunit A'' [Candidatus Methanomethylophilaceae archaeon]